MTVYDSINSCYRLHDAHSYFLNVHACSICFNQLWQSVLLHLSNMVNVKLVAQIADRNGRRSPTAVYVRIAE